MCYLHNCRPIFRVQWYQPARLLAVLPAAPSVLAYWCAASQPRWSGDSFKLPVSFLNVHTAEDALAVAGGGEAGQPPAAQQQEQQEQQRKLDATLRALSEQAPSFAGAEEGESEGESSLRRGPLGWLAVAPGCATAWILPS